MSKPSLRIFHPNQASDTTETQKDKTDLLAKRLDSMATDRLDRELDRIAGASEPKTVAISLGQIVPLLMDAAATDRAWLADFADDQVRIDSDLYEVLLAYQNLSQRAAA